MRAHIFLFMAMLLSASGLYAAEYARPAVASLPFADLVRELQQGGLVIYIRHASTERDYADQLLADVNNGATQRVLSEAGWHEAAHIGHAFRFYNIPVGKVYSSEYFRAWQTAWLAFGRYEKQARLNFLPFEDYTEAQTQEMRRRVLPLVSARPPAGVNTVIVGHDDPFEAVAGIYPEPMGVAYVLRPLGDKGIEVLGRIAPDGWGGGAAD